MDPTIRSRLEGMKSQALALQVYFKTQTYQTTIWNDVALEAAGHVAKELVKSTGLSGIIPPRKGSALAKKYLRERDQAKLRDFKQMRELELSTKLNGLIEQVSLLDNCLNLSAISSSSCTNFSNTALP